MTDAFDSMDLNTAYEIAGGYIEADDKTFEQALKMVREDDDVLLKSLKTLMKLNAALPKNKKKKKLLPLRQKKLLKMRLSLKLNLMMKN